MCAIILFGFETDSVLRALRGMPVETVLLPVLYQLC